MSINLKGHKELRHKSQRIALTQAMELLSTPTLRYYISNGESRHLRTFAYAELLRRRQGRK